jgi:hypothetical protein
MWVDVEAGIDIDETIEGTRRIEICCSDSQDGTDTFGHASSALRLQTTVL